MVILAGKGQDDENVGLKEYYADAEFFLAQEFYADALHDYLEISKRGFADNANINYKIGICYLNIPGQKDKSIQYLEKAKESASLKYRESSLKEKYAPIDVYLNLGNAYRINNMVDKAIETYKVYKSLIPSEEVNLQSFADKQIETCNVANEYMHNPVNVDFQNLGPEINSSTDDYKAVFSGDGDKIVYMHKLPFYNAVYFSIKVNGHWTKPQNITPQIMSDGDQYVCSISYDGNTLLLTKEDEFNSDIYISKFVDNRWTKSEPLGSNINTKYWESHACLSKDGKLLYFASNRKDGIGDMDIWVSRLEPDGTWGKARNLGNKINTQFNEDTPFITESGKSLYFSSQGFANMGGYDLFVSHLEDDSTWSVPENLGYPFSTTDDDLFYFPSHEGKYGYISRILPEGYGGYDIYRIGEKEEMVEPIAEGEKIEENPVIPAIQAEQPLTSQNVAEQKDTAAMKEEMGKKDTTEENRLVEEKEILPEIVEKPNEKLLETPSIAQVKTIDISPIFFDFDKSSLSNSGKSELNKIAELMKSDLKVNVLLLGFADALGPEDYNIRLSEQRALQTMKYLVQKGVEASRIKIIGKGETDFIAPNTKADGSDYPEARKYNRRVEFEISGIDRNTIILKRIDPVPVEMRIKNN